jgi:hypothetical protein
MDGSATRTLVSLPALPNENELLDTARESTEEGNEQDDGRLGVTLPLRFEDDECKETGDERSESWVFVERADEVG